MPLDKCWRNGHDYGEDSVDPHDDLGLCARHKREMIEDSLDETEPVRYGPNGIIE